MYIYGVQLYKFLYSELLCLSKRDKKTLVMLLALDKQLIEKKLYPSSQLEQW